MSQEPLKGRIAWIPSDFKFKGTYTSKDETSFFVTNVSDVVIQDYMIKFFTEPYEFNGMSLSYYVNLLIDEYGSKYVGKFTLESDPEFEGQVTCELYENKGKYLLYGSWIENEVIYSWIAEIEKTKKA